MTRPATSLLVLFTTIASPAAASGFTGRVLDLCSPGRFSTCASVQLSVIQTPVGSRVVVRIRNMQGSNPYDKSGGSTLTQFLLVSNRPYFLWFDPDRPCLGCEARLATEGRVRTYGGVEPGNLGTMDTSYYELIWGPIGVAWLLFDSQNPLALGFFGCDQGPFPREDNLGNQTTRAIATCPAQGYTGWFTWTFQTNQRIEPHELGYDIGFWGASGALTGCGYNVPSWAGSTCIVTPEPTTLALLATGLGSAGLAWRGRRRVRPTASGVSS